MGPTKMQEGPSARALSRAGPTLVFAEILTENGAPVRLVLDSSTTVDPITCGAKEALVLAMNRGVCVWWIVYYGWERRRRSVLATGMEGHAARVCKGARLTKMPSEAAVRFPA